MTEKVKWIREECRDMFEGIPCDYPNCTCSPENRQHREQDYEDYLHREIERERERDRRIADHVDGFDRDDLGESADR